MGVLQWLADRTVLGGVAEAAVAAFDDDPTTVPFQDKEVDPIIFLGTVVNAKDGDHAGKLYVKAKPFGSSPRWVHASQPCAGAGYGMLMTPGIGSTVVIAKNMCPDDPPCDYMWLGGVYVPTTVTSDSKPQPYERGQKDLILDEIPDDGSAPDDTPVRTYGVPTNGGSDSNIYHDNNQPNSFIIKHPSQHLISMTEKHVDDKHIDEIKVKTHGNKRIILSDADSKDGGEIIHLVDENDNQVKIRSSAGNDEGAGPDSLEGYVGKNIHWTSNSGEVHHMISGGSGDFAIEQAGSGDVKVDVHKANCKIKTASNTEINADKEVKITAGSKITMTVGASTFTMTPASIQMIVGSTIVTISPVGVDIL
jgi:hypothetical protein